MRLLGGVLAALCALPVAAQQITSAQFIEPTERYSHAILGDGIEWGALRYQVAGQGSVTVRLPLDHVFEDVAPRLWDVDGDGDFEVAVVETDMARGAALAIYGPKGKIAETPHIGQAHRWLAPIGAADLDGDGAVEIAYVDRPHLAKTVRIWRFEDGKLNAVADLPGFTNHRIGERDIAGGMRICAGAPQMIVATADWSRVAAITFGPEGFAHTDMGPHSGRGSFAAAMACN